MHLNDATRKAALWICGYQDDQNIAVMDVGVNGLVRKPGEIRILLRMRMEMRTPSTHLCITDNIVVVRFSPLLDHWHREIRRATQPLPNIKVVKLGGEE